MRNSLRRVNKTKEVKYYFVVYVETTCIMSRNSAIIKFP